MEENLCELRVQILALKSVGFGLTGDKISKLFSFLDGRYRAGSVVHHPFSIFLFKCILLLF